mgnify:CR=1 FL=1
MRPAHNFSTALHIFFVVAILLVASFAHAESVVWSTNTGQLNYSLHKGSLDVTNANLSVLYAASVINTDTGVVLMPGAQVPKGTNVRF